MSNKKVKNNSLEKQAITTVSPEAPKGLQNFGNTCFANASFQILFNIREFREGLHQFYKAYKKSLQYCPVLESSFQFIDEYYIKQNPKTITMDCYKTLLKRLETLTYAIRIGRQGRSNELICAYLQMLKQEIQRNQKGTPLPRFLELFKGTVEYVEVNEETANACEECGEASLSMVELPFLAVKHAKFLDKNLQANLFEPLVTKCSSCQRLLHQYGHLKIVPEYISFWVETDGKARNRKESIPEELEVNVLHNSTTKIGYKFYGAVCDSAFGRSDSGSHDIAIIKLKEHYYYCSDDYCREIDGLQDVRQDPKLVFYKKNSPEEIKSKITLDVNYAHIPDQKAHSPDTTDNCEGAATNKVESPCECSSEGLLEGNTEIVNTKPSVNIAKTNKEKIAKEDNSENYAQVIPSKEKITIGSAKKFVSNDPITLKATENKRRQTNSRSPNLVSKIAAHILETPVIGPVVKIISRILNF
jgi:hypothetical protein